MKLPLTLALVAIIAGSLPAVAPAAGPIPVTQLTPAQSTNLPPGSTPTFRIDSTCTNQLINVLVANQEVYDADGLFAQSATVDKLTLSESPLGTYQGVSRSPWLSTPGTYYWQATTVADCGSGVVNPLVSPTVGIIVAAPPASDTGGTGAVELQDSGELLTLSQAKASLGSIIQTGTRRTGKRVSGRCTRRGSGSVLVVFCTARWSDGKKYTYNGSVREALNDDGSITARFDGRRATLACIKQTARKVDEKRCFKKFRFDAQV